MKLCDKTVRDYMARLGKRKKRMSLAAIAQRQAAGRRSGAARRRAAARPAAPGSAVLAQSELHQKGSLDKTP